MRIASMWPNERRDGGSVTDLVFLMVVAHGATGWLDEIVEFGLPLAVLVVLYVWSNRKPKPKEKPPK